jgi:hypothetical protein
VLGPAGGIGAVALGVTSWFAQKRAGAPSPVSHYLLSVDTALTTTPWQRVKRALGAIRQG